MGFKNTLLPVALTLQSRGRLLDLLQPAVMGILNATPDSFYNRGRDSALPGLLRLAERMLAEGAAILDIGGASSRPGAAAIPVDEELQRVVPVIEALSREFPEAWLSVDTWHARVAEDAVGAGAAIINDISAGDADRAMTETAARLRVPLIAMHMQGTPQTMQDNPQYEDVVREVFDYLKQKTQAAAAAGISDLIVDPGFGFGKHLSHNYELLSDLHLFRALGRPVLAGISRKGMIWKALGTDPDGALNGTTALHMAALQQGASILRVHDVREAAETIRLFGYLS